MNDLRDGLFSLCVIAGISLPYVDFFPIWIGYGVALAVLCAVALLAVLRLDTIALNPFVGAGLLLLMAIQLFHLVVDSPTSWRFAARPAVFLLEGFVLFALWPQLVPVNTFLSVVRAGGVVISIIGMPTVFLNHFGPLTAYHTTTSVAGYRVNIFRSIFGNPNMTGFVLAFAVIATVFELVRNKRRHHYLTLLALSIPLLLTTSRAALMMAVVGAYLVVLIEAFEEQTAKPLIVLSLVGGVVAFVGIYVTDVVPIGGRKQIWPAAIEAFAKRPLIGYGAGDTGAYIEPYLDSHQLTSPASHNSYLRVALTSGIIGLAGYLGILVGVVRSVATRLGTNDGHAITPLFIAVSVQQFFSNSSMLGLSITSGLTAMTVGYGAHLMVQREGGWNDMDE